MSKSDDTISRQAAINAIENTDCELSSDEWDELTDAIMQVPSAEPKKGRWDVEHGVFMHDDIYGDIYRCSVCGYRERNPEGFNYCPNCGAKMEVVK